MIYIPKWQFWVQLSPKYSIKFFFYRFLNHTKNEPTHEKRDLSIVWFVILQTVMHGYPVRPDQQSCMATQWGQINSHAWLPNEARSTVMHGYPVRPDQRSCVAIQWGQINSHAWLSSEARSSALSEASSSTIEQTAKGLARLHWRRRFTWAFAGCLCDKYPFLMRWLKYFILHACK